jgi:hypothetical protein
MDWAQVLTVFAVIATNLGTIIALYIQLDKKIEENRKETNEIIRSNNEANNNVIRAIQQEIKDFHGRLCIIEERAKK